MDMWVQLGSSVARLAAGGGGRRWASSTRARERALGAGEDGGVDRGMQRLVVFNPQGVANVLGALAAVGWLLEEIQRLATVTAGVFNPHGVANVLWVWSYFRM